MQPSAAAESSKEPACSSSQHMGTQALLRGWQNINPICSRCPCYHHHPLLRAQHRRTSAPCLHSWSRSEASAQLHVAPNHTPHILVGREVHLPSACHLWAGGRATVIYGRKTPTCTSPFLSLVFGLPSLLAQEAADAVRRGAGTSLAPLPLESSSHLWSLGFTQRFSEKKKKRGPQDKYAFNKQ